MYCRHCTRKRKVGDVDSIPSEAEVIESLDYIREIPGIRDVLLSGGDPFMLPDDRLDWILTELDDIEHVEVVRFGTQVPVVLPYRVTDELCAMLARHHPLWVNTHFNHRRRFPPPQRRRSHGSGLRRRGAGSGILPGQGGRVFRIEVP